MVGVWVYFLVGYRVGMESMRKKGKYCMWKKVGFFLEVYEEWRLNFRGLFIEERKIEYEFELEKGFWYWVVENFMCGLIIFKF